MNKNLKKIMDYEFTQYRQTLRNMLPHPPAVVHFDAGFTAAIPHVRLDEREKILKLLEKKTKDITEEYGIEIHWADWIEQELKRMDENE